MSSPQIDPAEFHSFQEYHCPSRIQQLYENTSVSGIALVITSLAIKTLSAPLAAPIMGMGVSLIATKLVKKTLSWYDKRLLVDLTKKMNSFNQKYEQMQTIVLISAFVLSFIFKPIGLILGIALGCIKAIVLDIEETKLSQQANRKIS